MASKNFNRLPRKKRYFGKPQNYSQNFGNPNNYYNNTPNYFNQYSENQYGGFNNSPYSDNSFGINNYGNYFNNYNQDYQNYYNPNYDYDYGQPVLGRGYGPYGPQGFGPGGSCGMGYGPGGPSGGHRYSRSSKFASGHDNRNRSLFSLYDNESLRRKRGKKNKKLSKTRIKHLRAKLRNKSGGEFDTLPKKDSEFTSQLTEAQAGITEFISDGQGFQGTIKARFSDFHVNEIDLDGNICKLTSTDVPNEPVKEIDEDYKKSCNDQLPEQIWEKIQNLLKEDTNSSVEVDVTDKDKETRTKIHEALKLKFGKQIVSKTIQKDDRKFIEFKKYSKEARIDTRKQWPTNREGEYLYFLLHKEHCDTLEAALRISDAIQAKASKVTYAGTKDRRGKTTQWFCIKKTEPKLIKDKTAHIRFIYVGNFCFKPEILRLGDLSGNRFRICLRFVQEEDEIVNNALTKLKENGFINYYGLQRFGNNSKVSTFSIGKHLLRGDWKEACDLILQPRQEDTDIILSTVKLLWKDQQDAQQCLKILGKRRNRSVEGKLIQGLAKNNKNDYLNALNNIPRNMRLLYLHSYQSYVWNRIVSRRIKEFGLKPIVGDIVLNDDNAQNYNRDLYNVEDQSEDDAEEENTVPIKEENELGNIKKEETISDDQKTELNIIVKEEKIDETKSNGKEISNIPQQPKIKFLTENDLSNYTIYDIVLPLPGFDVQYPNNVCRDWYKEMLEADGLTLEMDQQRSKSYSVSGAYRKCVNKCENMSWKIGYYDDPLQSLIQSDLEELRSEPAGELKESGTFKAVIIDFCLNSSAYATMALREAMKQDTSRNAMTRINKLYDEAIKKAKETLEPKKIEAETTEKNNDDTLNENQTNGNQSNGDNNKRKMEDDCHDEQVIKKIKIDS